MNLLWGQVMKYKCTKCGNDNGWLELQDEIMLVHRCLCGLNKVLYTESKGIRTLSISIEPPPHQLLKKGTMVEQCMRVMLQSWPDALTTEKVFRVITVDVGLSATRSDISTRLMLLQHKGLIEKVLCGKGKVGGSTWEITEYGETVYNLGV